jgi:hypothetical protein
MIDSRTSPPNGRVTPLGALAQASGPSHMALLTIANATAFAPSRARPFCSVSLLFSHE